MFWFMCLMFKVVAKTIVKFCYCLELSLAMLYQIYEDNARYRELKLFIFSTVYISALSDH